MNAPATSIIVPVYRTPIPLLQRFLRSAREQTLADIEIILVDDASPDECPRILDEAAARDPRLTVVHRGTNGRAGVARNDGLERARGEYVLFADADDVIRPDMCETLVGLARARGAEIVACSWSLIDAEGCRLGQIRLPDRTHNLLSSASQKTRCFRTLNYAPWNKVFRRATIAKMRFEQFEANIGEDTLFNVAAICRSRRMVTTSYVGYGYTLHSASATGRSIKGMPYLRTIALSEDRIRQTLTTRDGSAVGRKAADWLALKRFTTGCGWIAENPDPRERRALWAFWRRHFREELLPALEHRGFLAAWYRLAVTARGPAGARRLTLLATTLADPVSILEHADVRSAIKHHSEPAWPGARPEST